MRVNNTGAGEMMMRRVAVMSLLLVACGGGDAQEAAEPAAEAGASREMVLQATDVAVVQQTRLSGGVVLTGTLNPERIVEVRAQVPGVVSRLAVDRGDRVGAGQLIASIEAEGIRSAAAGAQAQIAAANAALALARQRHESAKKLYERGAISQIELQTAEAAFESAQAQQAAARAQSASASESARRANIVSPIAGEVSNRMVSQGEAVNPGQPLVTIVNTSTLELAGQVPVQAAARVTRGQKVEFALDAYPGQVFNGVVSRVDPTADPATRQVGVYLRLPNQNGRIVGGVFARGMVLTNAADSALAIPATAVRTEGGGTFVWLVDQNRLTKRPVVTGTTEPTSGLIEIISGLAAGDRVLVAPGAVEEGMAVKFSSRGGPASTTGG